MTSIANVSPSEGQELITPAQAGAATRVDALHEALAQRVLAGDRLETLAGQIADVLDVGILVTSTDGREQAAALAPDVRALLRGADLADETGRVRVEWFSEAPADLAGGEIRSIPVSAPGLELAHLLALSPKRRLGSEEVGALERAATVVALWITREQAVSAVEHKYRGDFLRDVLLGRAGGTDFVLEHASGFGWDLARPLVVLSAQMDAQPAHEQPATQQQRRQWQERFAAAWRQVTAATDPGSPTADFSSEVVTVLPATGDPETLVAQLVHVVAGDKGGGRRSFSVGVSRVSDGTRGLPEAYAQARRAVEVGRRVHGPGSTTWFDRLGLHRLIAMVPDSAELRAFAHDVLGELAHDTEEAATLRATLQVLLDTNFNVAEAARLQFFHYNTVRYRVGKLERLIGPLSRDANLRLDAAVALKVLEITG
jgi:purine catabolism regulator